MYITQAISILSLVLEFVDAGIITAVGNLKCPPLTIKRGGVRLRSRGRIAKYTCLRGFQLLGERYSTCLRGRWDTPPPVCISSGCPLIDDDFPHGQSFESYKGALVKFHCDPGYSLIGSAALYCNGISWNDTIPICKAEIPVEAQRQCDFESEDLCGWTHGLNHDFDWKRHNFATPSGHTGTGPAYDHTLGSGLDGHYMYLEASNPRLENDTARLFSPVYPGISNTDACFIFWYHMYGANTGSLNVYLYTKTVTLLFSKKGNHGNVWLKGNLPLPPIDTNFQIVIEGIRGAGYIGDTAIDDVKLAEGSECVEESVTGSCEGRCFSTTPLDTTACECTSDCVDNSTCCYDFLSLCGVTGLTSEQMTEATDIITKLPIPVVNTDSTKFISTGSTFSMHNFTYVSKNNNIEVNSQEVITQKYISSPKTEIGKSSFIQLNNISHSTTPKPFTNTKLSSTLTASNNTVKLSFNQTTPMIFKPWTFSVRTNPNITLTRKPTTFIPTLFPVLVSSTKFKKVPIILPSPQLPYRYTTRKMKITSIATTIPTKVPQFPRELNLTKNNVLHPYWFNIKTPKPNVKIQDKFSSEGQGNKISKQTKTSSVKKYKTGYKIKGVEAQVLSPSKNESAASVVAGIGLIALLIIVVTAAFTCYMRKRRINRNTNEDGEADVLFFTTDEYLDFRLARPTPES